jgi:hypothetical protein
MGYPYVHLFGIKIHLGPEEGGLSEIEATLSPFSGLLSF